MGDSIEQLKAELDEARATSESWRRAYLAWQLWGDSLRSLIRCTLNGDEPTRQAIENRLRSWREQRDFQAARAVKAEAEVERLKSKEQP